MSGGPAWLPVRPHPACRRSHLARVGRLARASALLLMRMQSLPTAIQIIDLLNAKTLRVDGAEGFRLPDSLPFGHIPRSRRPPCPGGQVGEGITLSGCTREVSAQRRRRQGNGQRRFQYVVSRTRRAREHSGRRSDAIVGGPHFRVGLIYGYC